MSKGNRLKQSRFQKSETVLVNSLSSFLLTLLFCVVANGVHASESCAVIVGAPTIASQSGDRTQELIAYLQKLLDRNTIGERELQFVVARAGVRASEKILQNPISIGVAAIDHSAQIHRQGLEALLRSKQIDLEKVLNFVRERLKEMNKTSGDRKKTSKNTFVSFETTTVGPGQFEGPDGKTIKLTHTIEVMSTTATNAHWNLLMRHRLAQKYGSQDPDYPAVGATFWSILEFANRLSTHKGLKPVFDLSKIKWKPGTRAEDGTLQKKEGNLWIADYYEREGWRLPTDAEFEYLLYRAAGSVQEYGSAVSPAELQKYAWISRSSGSSAHNVGELDPFRVGDGNLYDLIGNVWQWVWNRSQGSPYDNPVDLKSGENPLGLKRGSMRIVRGGDAGSDPCFWKDLRAHSTTDGAPGVGFRLVRTIHE